jgi:hypothetical protein
MTANFNIKGQHVMYCAVTTLAAAAYLWLGDDSYSPPETLGRPFVGEELPALSLVEGGIPAEGRRNLFAFVKPDQTPEPALVTAPLPALRVEAPPQDADLLADLKVVGVVRRPGVTTVLLQIGAKLSTVALGERFGTGDALSVEAVQGSNVLIVDNNTKNSKLFPLSEE